MSRDLFAEFGDFGTNASSSASLQPSPEVATSVSSHSLSTHQTNSSFARGDWSGFATTEPPANETQIDDTEDWGDFEVAGNDVQEQQTNISAAPDRGQHLPAALNNLDLHDGGASRTSGAQTFTESGRKKLSSNHPFARNPDILFDAEDPSEPDDDFGDFEDAQPEPVTATATAPRMQQNTTHSAPLQSQAKPQPLSMDLLDWDVPIEPATVQKTQQRVPQSTPLSHQARPQPSSMDPLDWEPKPSVPTAAVAQTPPRPKLPSVKSHARRTNSISNSVRLSQAPATHRRTPSKTTAPAPAPEEDFSAWDDFEPSAAPLVTQVTTQAPASISEPDSTLANSITLPSQILSPIAETDGSTTLPPPNIPPPSLLLTLFTPLLTLANTHFLQPLLALTASRKTALLSSPQTHTFLRNYIALSSVLARIIAGRKQRWKRDRFLAQSMRIGPSVSGRSGGMKLAGLDRSEAGHEDREVVDVLRGWQGQVGRLRNAVAGANATTFTSSAGGAGAAQLPQVPEIAETMPVRVAKAGEGGIASVHACGLCGLKREERIVKVDVDVEDSFGEWWAEGPSMHVACRNFWDAHKEDLRSR